MDLKYSNTLPLILLVLLVGAVMIPAQSRGGIAVDPNVTLPVTVEKTWYRTGKVRLFGKAYEQSGTLTVSENGVDFSFKKGTVNIPKGSIIKVEWGQLSPDMQNEWVIVHYTDPAGEAIAAFKGALFSGGDKDALIFSAILKINASASSDAQGEVRDPE
jgi:hypothetical protein